MNAKIPSFLTKKSNIIRFLVFTAFFSLIFINIYEPFNSTSWTEYTRTVFFLYSCLMIIAGTLVLAVSRLLMYRFHQKHSIYYWEYAIWLFVEIAFISLIYTFFIRFVIGFQKDFILLFWSTLLYTLLILILPYMFSWLYFALRDTEKRLTKILEEEELIDFENSQKDLINFTDEKGTLRFSVKLPNLIYIESSDNYVEIHYLNKGKLSRFVLRNTLKSIQDSVKNSNLVRCHRSYIINFSKVKILRKDKEGLFIEMDIEEVPDIPVSKTYAESITQLFSRHSL